MDRINFILTGHVDHGKSTLAGHILYKCGYINNHEFEKISEKAKENGMPTWKYAYILDIFDEEMRRGKTFDFTFVDLIIIIKNLR